MWLYNPPSKKKKKKEKKKRMVNKSVNENANPTHSNKKGLPKESYRNKLLILIKDKNRGKSSSTNKL